MNMISNIQAHSALSPRGKLIQPTFGIHNSHNGFGMLGQLIIQQKRLLGNLHLPEIPVEESFEPFEKNGSHANSMFGGVLELLPGKPSLSSLGDNSAWAPSTSTATTISAE